ncbi:MAG TPA: oxidoreductase [Rhodospirillales bacterium]|nr:oxidoreductase [Rhodospirillales bacterium]
MPEVRIYQPTKSAMQSGRGKVGTWVLEYAPQSPQRADPLMGWIGSQGTLRQVKMKFDSRDEAVAFAKKNELSYSVKEPKTRRIVGKNYSDNFAYDRLR